MDSETRQEPTSYQRAHDADGDIAYKAEASAFDDLACEPASHETDQQYDENSLIRNMHCSTPVVAAHNRNTERNTQAVQWNSEPLVPCLWQGRKKTAMLAW